MLVVLRWTLVGICFAPAAQAQQVAPKYDPSAYEHRSADIAMRDGVKLHVEIFSPKGATEPLPFLLERCQPAFPDIRVGSLILEGKQQGFELLKLAQAR